MGGWGKIDFRFLMFNSYKIENTLALNVIKLRANSAKNGKFLKIEKPPRPLGTPPKEGKLRNFPSFGGVPERRGGFYPIS